MIAYTGYDMEDALIINKGSYERGFAHGALYKTEVIDLDRRRKTASRSRSSSSAPGEESKSFGNVDPHLPPLEDGNPRPKTRFLDADGLP